MSGGIVLPAGVKAPQAPKPLALEDLTDEQREAIKANAAKVSPEESLPKVLTAFAIVIDKDGAVSVDPALVKGVVSQRPPTNSDIIGALANLQSEIDSNLTAIKTANIMMQQAQAAQQQFAEQQRIASIQQRIQPGLRG